MIQFDITTLFELNADHYGANDQTQQKTWILVIQVAIYVGGTFLLLLSLFNVYNYLIKQGRYKEFFIVTIYASSILILIMDMIGASQVEIRSDPCNVGLVISLYGVRWLNQILGVCQAGILTTLVIQLKKLFAFMKQLSGRESEVEDIKALQIKKFNNLCRINRIVVVVSTCMILGIYFADTYIWLSMTYKKDICDAEEIRFSDTILLYYEVYIIVHTVIALAIDIWLIIVTILIHKLLNKSVVQGLGQEKRRIQMILIGFVVAFGIWTIFDVTVNYWGIPNWPDFTISVVTLLITPALGNFCPIGIILYTHFRNIMSTQKVFMLFGKRRSTLTPEELRKSYRARGGDFEIETEEGRHKEYTASLILGTNDQLYEAPENMPFDVTIKKKTTTTSRASSAAETELARQISDGTSTLEKSTEEAVNEFVNTLVKNKCHKVIVSEVTQNIINRCYARRANSFDQAKRSDIQTEATNEDKDLTKFVDVAKGRAMPKSGVQVKAYSSQYGLL